MRGRVEDTALPRRRTRIAVGRPMLPEATRESPRPRRRPSAAQPVEVRRRPRRSRPRSRRSPSKRVCAGLQRAREPVVRALREQKAAGLVERGVGDDDHERRVGAGLPRTARASGTPALTGGSGRAGDDRAVGRDHVADRVHHRQGRDAARPSHLGARPRRRHRAPRTRGPATSRRSRPHPRRRGRVANGSSRAAATAAA